MLVLLRGLSFVPFHLYDSVWQYVGLRDLRAIVASVTASSLLFCLLIRGVLGLRAYPRSVFLMDLVLVVFLMASARVGWRLLRERRANTRTRRVLIFGAGDAGARIVREILKGGEHGYHPVGFVDDDPAKMGRRIHGIPVLGTRADLPRIIDETKPDRGAGGDRACRSRDVPGRGEGARVAQADHQGDAAPPGHPRWPGEAPRRA